MLYLLTWTSVLLLVGLWSLLVWALHAVAAWTIGSAGALKGAAPDPQAWQWPQWLTEWIPPEWAEAPTALAASIAPLLDGLVAMAPWITGGVGVLAWVVWALGAALLVGIGGVLHLLVALWRRRARRALPGGTAVTTA